MTFKKENEVIISGRLTQEPEFKAIGQKGTPLAKFSIAVDNSYKKGEEWVNQAFFFDVECWSFLVDKAQDLHKGDPVRIKGSLKQSIWNDKNGGKRSSVSIVAKEFYFLSKSEERIDPRVPEVKPEFYPSDDDDVPF